ncbi:unnamed protein product [Diatraea saccharalis]|uniref:Phospholipid scramblase n=1 Tax=Diatraea saccharalis TaxID=40085 RepID=A0A9N9WJV0_9NEOP|nr:unnamed protein product [Diatraea saccharalis]
MYDTCHGDASDSNTQHHYESNSLLGNQMRIKDISEIMQTASAPIPTAPAHSYTQLVKPADVSIEPRTEPTEQVEPVFAPPGQKIGSVEQQWTAVRPVYLVKNANGEHKFWIRGPYITLSCFRDVQFHIARMDGVPVGATNKRWQGLTHAMFFSPVMDKFGVAFEQTLTDEEKGLLLAATILMDYMYYDV